MADMGKVRGWLRQRERADGVNWLWCYQHERPSDGKIVENAVKLGPVADIGDETAAWIRVGELGLKAKYFQNAARGQQAFGRLANHYIEHGLPFNKRNGKRKGKGTIYLYLHALNDFILPRWRDDIAAKIKPLSIRDWLYSLHDDEDYDWQTLSKLKMIMGQVFDHADTHDLEACRNPIKNVMVPGSEDTDREVRVLEPQETLAVIKRLDYPEKILVVLVAVTAVRFSGSMSTSKVEVFASSKRSVSQKSPKPKPNRPKPMCRCVSCWRSISNTGEARRPITGTATSCSRARS
jgi:hypothetical protein